MQEICIIIPCYNEGNRLPAETYTKFLEQNECSLFFVNDGSKDNTLEVLQELESAFPTKVKVIDLNRNSGKAEAVRQGFLEAFCRDRFRYIGYLDADLATPLEEIEYLLRYFDRDIAVIIGSRVKRLGADIERDLHRHYLGRIFATMASLYLDIAVYDSQCGAKIFERQMAEELFREPFASRWLFDLELLYRLKKKGAVQFERTILEVPLRTWKEKGDSRIKLLDFISAPFELFRIKKSNNKSSEYLPGPGELNKSEKRTL